MSFKVTRDTLIPREDSSGLVDLALVALKESHSKRLLDIGTGTGILAISIKKECPEANVSAVDISKAALEVAQENAAQHDVDILFYLGDSIAPLPKGAKFEVIVSNPPYIGRHELEEMDESVKKYEPELALFAENDGLAFYEKLAKELPEWLMPNGTI